MPRVARQITTSAHLKKRLTGQDIKKNSYIKKVNMDGRGITFGAHSWRAEKEYKKLETKLGEDITGNYYRISKDALREVPTSGIDKEKYDLSRIFVRITDL